MPHERFCLELQVPACDRCCLENFGSATLADQPGKSGEILHRSGEILHTRLLVLTEPVSASRRTLAGVERIQEQVPTWWCMCLSLFVLVSGRSRGSGDSSSQSYELSPNAPYAYLTLSQMGIDPEVLRSHATPQMRPLQHVQFTAVAVGQSLSPVRMEEYLREPKKRSRLFSKRPAINSMRSSDRSCSTARNTLHTK